MSPGLSAVGRLVNAVASGKIGTLKSFATPDVDRFRLRRRNGERANRAGWLIVEDRFPRVAVVSGLPDAAVVDSYIKDVWLTRNAGGADSPSGTEWTNHPPPHSLKLIAADLLRLCVRTDQQAEKRAKVT